MFAAIAALPDDDVIMVSDDDVPAAAVEDYPANFDNWTDDGQFEHIFGRKFFVCFRTLSSILSIVFFLIQPSVF